jgi:flavin reductase (DIM6/NTAB) family NADH-FMN oxidoreductase RutF
MAVFKSIQPEEFKDNAFSLISTDWMLITAGNKQSFNMMTASWGSLGHLWNRNIAVIYIRPTRYTYSFAEKNDYFTICFFNEKYREILNICGSTSGRDSDKIKATGLIPLETELGNIYYEQARLVMECEKIYYEDIKPEMFLDKSIERMYPQKDYHRMYIGEIINTLINE